MLRMRVCYMHSSDGRNDDKKSFIIYPINNNRTAIINKKNKYMI